MNNVSLGIRGKLLLPGLVALLVVAALVQWVWLPARSEVALTAIERSQVPALRALELALVEPLLSRNLGQVHSTLNAVLQTGGANWKRLELRDEKNQRIYPLAESGSVPVQWRVLTQPIDADGFSLGKLTLYYDPAPDLADYIKHEQYLVLWILFLFLLALAASFFWQERLIRRPAQQLMQAARQLSRGDFDTPLPLVGSDELGQLSRDMGIMRDGLRDLDASLRNERAHVGTILDSMVDGIISIDHTGHIVSFNPAAERIFGYGAEEVSGRNVSMLMPNPHRDAHDGYLRNYQATGEARIIGIGREVEGQRRDGSLFPMDLAISELTRDGQPVYVGTVRDITERKRVERMKNEFISTVSHELRTPLTSIRGSLGLITGGVLGELPEQVQAMLNIASNNTERLLMLINDILDIQKIEAGKMAFRFETIALMPLLEKAVAELATYGDQHGVRFEISRRLDDVYVYADRDRLMQVLANLMSNAAKFSPRDCKVEIAVAHHHDGRVRVSISDYGPGIPDAFKAQIFQAFTQSDSSDTRSKGGTGLGLAITKAIIERHGGQVDFVSREGVGTTFYIEMPEMRGGEENATDQPRTLLQTHRACVLIVEDDPDIAALIRRILTEAGFDSDVAYSAQQARQLLAERGNCYRLMTLDLKLPDEDGMSLLESLRRDAATQALPVVVVSVLADDFKRQLVGGALDVMDWLQKPIDTERLVSVIRGACDGGKQPRVLHVEDDPDVRAVVAGMLKGHCDLVSRGTLADAREVLETEPFDLVLLDIGLPDGSGLDLIEIVDRRLMPPRIVIFSATDVGEEYADRVSAVLVKSRSDNQELLRVMMQSMRKS